MRAWTFLIGMLTGGSLLRTIDYLIAWRRERREQAAAKIAHEKDRPRFRVDIRKAKGRHASVDSLIVKILSLGSLPLTIDKGEVFIEASHYPERVESKKLDSREISSVQPIELEFSLPLKLVDPPGVREPPLVKLVCKFSYSNCKSPEHYEATYDHKQGDFLPATKISHN